MHTTCARRVRSSVEYLWFQDFDFKHACVGVGHFVRCECQIECDHFLLVRKFHMCQTKPHVESCIHFPYLLLCTWAETHAPIMVRTYFHGITECEMRIGIVLSENERAGCS